MPDRPRHKYQAYEEVLRSLERQGWTVWLAGNGHFRAYCPTGCRCRQSFPSTPSSTMSLTRHTTYLRNHTCWEDDR